MTIQHYSPEFRANAQSILNHFARKHYEYYYATMRKIEHDQCNRRSAFLVVSYGASAVYDFYHREMDMLDKENSGEHLATALINALKSWEHRRYVDLYEYAPRRISRKYANKVMRKFLERRNAQLSARLNNES